MEKKRVKNVLSYEFGTIFTGREILDWIMYQIATQGGAKRLARKLNEHYTFIPDAQYRLIKLPSNTGCGAPIKIGFARVQQKTI